MVQTWVFWTAIIFQAFIGIMITIGISWFMVMRAKGEWGGGTEVIDFSPYPEGEPRKFRILKNGPLYVHSAGGEEGVIIRELGMFKTEHMKIKVSDMIRAGNMFFFGRKGIEKIFGVHLQDKDQVIVQLRNSLSQVNHELSKKNHKIDEVQDRISKVLNDTAKAVMGFNKPSTTKKK